MKKLLALSIFSALILPQAYAASPVCITDDVKEIALKYRSSEIPGQVQVLFSDNDGDAGKRELEVVAIKLIDRHRGDYEVILKHPENGMYGNVGVTLQGDQGHKKSYVFEIVHTEEQCEYSLVLRK